MRFQVIVWHILVFVVLFSGCTKIQEYNETQKSELNIPKAPIVDQGIIQAEILNISRVNGLDVAKIKIIKIMNYTHDPRANYTALSENTELEVIFQWGIEAKTIDIPPINDPKNDISVPGSKLGDGISAKINNQYGWRIYEYELIQ